MSPLNPSPQDSGISVEEDTKGMQDTKELKSSTHNSTGMHINLQKLQQQAQGLKKYTPVWVLERKAETDLSIQKLSCIHILSQMRN